MATPSLARFHILGRLASGGMADVWLARTRGVAGFEKVVVIKTIRTDIGADSSFTEMFLNEARVAAALNHPNCVQIFDLGQENGLYYIAMEFIDGFSFSRLMRRCRKSEINVPLPVIARVIADAAAGLDHAHRLKSRGGEPLNLVHRDVSPDNILVDFHGQTKMVDFGIAKVNQTNDSGQTRAGVLKGKWGYMAPEYLMGQRTDGRADLFALGVVLYRALTGIQPFKGPTEPAVAKAVLMTEPPPLREIRPELPEALESLIKKTLAKSPEDRIQNGRDFRAQLLAAVPDAADSEQVAEFMAQVWPPGDPERSAISRLAQGQANASGTPVLKPLSSAGKTPGSGAVDIDLDNDFSAPSARAPNAPRTQMLDRQSGSALVVPAKSSSLPAILAGAALVIAVLTGLYVVVIQKDADKRIPEAPSTNLAHEEAPPPTVNLAETAQVNSAPEAPSAPLDAPNDKSEQESEANTEAEEPDEEPTAKTEVQKTRRITSRKLRRTRRPVTRSVPQKVEPAVAKAPEPEPEPEPVPEPAQAPTPAPSLPPEPEPVKLAVAAAPTPPAPKTTTQKVAPKPTHGYLDLRTSFAGYVFINGQNTGLLSPTKLRLPAGQHKLTIVVKGSNLRVARTVSVTAGKTRVLKMSTQ